jgi:uncharacterized membrane protein (DUF4010 family)
MSLTAAAASLAAALLVGLLIGAQREESHAHPGLRDFLLIALAAGVCALAGNVVLAAAGLIAVAILLGVFRVTEMPDKVGITTEFAGVATYVLAYLAAAPQFPFGRPLAIGTTLVVVVFLEAKERVHKLVRETITEAEFNATLAFVGTVLVIYPLLPPGAYGPYSFFAPRQVWLFVILVSSISYVGYFFEKFMGTEKGLFYTSLLGGLASTTAATLHFARLSRQRPQDTFELWRAFMIANTVQFPRTLLIVALVNLQLAYVCAWPLAAMLITGIVAAALLSRRPRKALVTGAIVSGNPFRLIPALRFGVLFTIIVFLTKFAAARLGTQAFMQTGVLGGLVDVATVIAPAADLFELGRLSTATAEITILLALAANAALKIVLAATEGTFAFAVRVAGAFMLWGCAAGLTWWIAFKI